MAPRHTPGHWQAALPTGLTLSSAGQISGTPSAAATFTFTVQVADGGQPQIASKQFSITIAAAPTTRTIWTSATVPGTVDAGPDSAVELGVKFKSDVNGSIVGIRFYKASTNVGTHVANIWTSTGTLLATATFTSETGSGWQQVNFTSPVAITANTVYVASYHTTGGHYSVDLNFFATAGVDNAPCMLYRMVLAEQMVCLHTVRPVHFLHQDSSPRIIGLM